MIKILVVDDEENICLLYEQELSEEGYEVKSTNNGKECLKALEEEHFDMVILDIKMPDMDGIETLGKIVNKYHDLPVILNTAYTSYQDDFRSWPAEAYVVKSSDLTELKQIIKDILEKRKS
jgi:DNA-binding NtrC family response regulator